MLSLNRLDELRLQDCCRNLLPPVHCDVFNTLPSTNSWLLDQSSIDNDLRVVLCEQQTAGKGRSGKSWHSSATQDITMSFRWRYPESCSAAISSVSLVTALVLAELCQQLIPPSELIAIKWPNDLICRNRKLAGILLEQLPGNELVIGVGVNVEPVSAQRAQQIDQAAIGLQTITKVPVDRTALVIGMIESMQHALAEFVDTGFDGFRDAWQKRDYLKDARLTHHLGDSVREGVGRGISTNGELILEDAMGNQRLIHAGTVRRIDL